MKTKNDDYQSSERHFYQLEIAVATIILASYYLVGVFA